jgi:hypothetical protein
MDAQAVVWAARIVQLHDWDLGRRRVVPPSQHDEAPNARDAGEDSSQPVSPSSSGFASFILFHQPEGSMPWTKLR